MHFEKKYENMWQYLWEVNFSDWISYWYDGDEIDLRKTKFRLWSLIVAFNRLESVLEQTICEFISDHEHNSWMLFIWWMSFSQKISILNKYSLNYDYHVNNGRKKENIIYIINELKKAWEIRNACVHAYWHEQSKDWLVRISSKFQEQGTAIVYSKITDNDLDWYISFIEKLENLLRDFWEYLKE